MNLLNKNKNNPGFSALYLNFVTFAKISVYKPLKKPKTTFVSCGKK